MKFQVQNAVDPRVFDCDNPRPGIYRSAKGSILMKPENNVTNRGNEGHQAEEVQIWDVDTGRFIGKHCSDVKGEYFFLADFSKVTVTIDAAATPRAVGF